jgi:small subunit ribosomal protein S1
LGAGIEGLVHVSEISHQRVAHPQDVLQPGQEIKVQVLRTKDLGKRRKERISLSIKALEKDPWQEIKSQFPVGTVVEGKVDGLEDFGAFVELAEGVRGMVHVSEIADRRIGHPREVLSMGDQTKVVVLDVDIRRQRLRLSIRQVDTLESAANLKEFRERQQQEQDGVQAGNAMLDALQRAKLID